MELMIAVETALAAPSLTEARAEADAMDLEGATAYALAATTR